MNDWIRRFQQQLNQDFTLTALRVIITLWALAVIVATWLIKNKWLLAGIAAYEMLP